MKFKNMKKILVAALAAATVFFANSVSAETYTVESGDTLSAIASAFNTTVADLVKLNKINNINLIVVGQVLETNNEQEAEPAPAPEPEPTTTTVAEPVQSTEEVDPNANTNTNPNANTTSPTTTGASTTNTSDAEAAAKEEIARRESGGSYTAQNGQFYGRYQLMISYLNGDLSPENQERVADAYVASRYGSWVAALAHSDANGWY